MSRGVDYGDEINFDITVSFLRKGRQVDYEIIKISLP